MALVQYTKMWLTSVVTGDTYGWQTAPDRQRSFAVRGEIRTYAGGRQRAIGSKGTAGQWSFALVELTLADTELLKGWLDSGVTLFCKDHRGQSMYGTFFDLSLGEYSPATTYTDVNNRFRASVSINRVDVVEGV